MYKATYKGRYRVANPSKYRGDIHDVIYRSSWELKFMKWCDNNVSVLEWGSETMIIPYKSPVDSKVHRYFVDFYIRVKDRHGAITKYLIEKLLQVPELKIVGPTNLDSRGGTVSFTVGEIHPHDLGQYVDSQGVAVRTGHHCAWPLTRKLGVPATTRASLYLYNEESDCDALFDAILGAQKYFA